MRIYFIRKTWSKAYGCRALLCALVALQSSSAYADEAAIKAITRATEVYGIDTISKLKQLKVEESLYRYMQGQSGHVEEGSHSLVLHRYKQQLEIDFAAKSKSFKRTDENLIGNYGYHSLVTLDRRFVNGKGMKVDHCIQTYQPSTRMSWDSVAPNIEQSVDTLIIKELSDNLTNVSSGGVTYIQGHAHMVLNWTVNQVRKTAYVGSVSGLLSRLTTKQNGKTTRYDFLDHTQNNQGLTWASQTLVSQEHKPTLHVTKRVVTQSASTFPLVLKPDGYKLSDNDTFLDFAQASVNEIAKGVFLVGQGWGFTLFVDIGKSYISVGSWQMPNDTFTWQQRLNKLNQHMGTNKPVSQFIVTHHHDDHLMGLNEVSTHGTKILLMAEHQKAVEASLEKPLTPKNSALLLDGMMLANNKVQVFDVPSSHADHNLVVYLPKEKIVFAEDMFGSSLEAGFHSPNSWPSRDVYYRAQVLDERLKKLGIQAKHFVSSHHGRVLSNEEFKALVSLSCPENNVLIKRLYSS
ncbi:hypothetical protein [Pseudoalteromonas umbrosa]|uniref:hypothetical protein n=1 Tax=Pseudoalteromonas umbrosa TaxID=3048489 RepID=UPI0024C38C2C|nr:hypothetical protein [Pseudoalteromonas sp. B95]MDK1286792.1 hypothetical protein [Pseudoalteromonas sp. B95]